MLSESHEKRENPRTPPCDSLKTNQMEESADSGWKYLWGAKVQWPVDMPDDVLRFSVDLARKHFAPIETWQEEGDAAVAAMKRELDETWGPHWHVIAGKHFGSLVTHESRRFCFFYLDEIAVLIFKAG